MKLVSILVLYVAMGSACIDPAPEAPPTTEAHIDCDPTLKCIPTGMAGGVERSARSACPCGIVATPAPVSILLPAASWNPVVGSPALDENGVWVLETQREDDLLHELLVPPNSRITALEFHFNRNSTDPLTGELQFKLYSRHFGTTTVTSTPQITKYIASGSSWTTEDLVADVLGGVPFQTTPTDSYWLALKSATQFSGPPMFDGVRVIFAP